MGYNKKILSQAAADLNKRKAPKQGQDIIVDPRGQWEHPGQPTRIPGNNITMQGVPYPVYGVDNTGFAQMMYPGQDYQFQGDYVDEYPLSQAKRGGEKKYSRSITATNRLFKKNPLVKKKKTKNKKTFDPNAKYYQTGGDISIPELTELQEGGPKDKWGRSLSDKWYGFDPQTKKYTIAPYKIEELRRQASGVSKYDPLDQKAIPSETTQQAAKNLPSQKKSMNEAMALKAAERDATINKVNELPLITEDQRNEILMDPRKLDEYSYLNYLQGPDTVQESIPYSARERAWDIITNPFDAFEYAVRTGDISNMPRNYNKMKMAGIDPSAGGGANAVGNLLNTFNPLDAGDKVVRNVGEGNYGAAALNAARFIPSGGMLKSAVGRAGNLANQATNYVGSTNVVYNPVTRFTGLTPSGTTASNLVNKYGTVDKILKAGTIAKTAGYVPQASEDVYNIGKDIYNMYGADSKKQNLLQQDIQNRASNLTNMVYDTFLDYTKLNYAKPFKAAKYLDKSNENPDDVVSDYKAVKYLSPLLKRQTGGSQQCPPDQMPGPDGGCIPKEAQDLQEVTVYHPDATKSQLGLIDELRQAKKAYQDWREDAGLTRQRLRDEGASSFERLKEQTKEYKKQLEEEKKAYKKAQAALKSLQHHRPDEWKDAKLKDVLSQKGVEALRSLYSEEKISDQSFRDFYNSFGKDYDVNVKKGTGPNKQYSAKEAKQEWMENVPEFVQTVNNFAKGASILPALGVIGPSLAAGTQAMAPYYTSLMANPLVRTAGTWAQRAFLADTLINDVPETLKSLDQAIAGEKSWKDAAWDVGSTAVDLALTKGAIDDVVKLGKKAFAPVAKVLNTPVGEFVQSSKSLNRFPGTTNTAAGRFANTAREAVLNTSLTDAFKVAGVTAGLANIPNVSNKAAEAGSALSNPNLSQREKWDASKNFLGEAVKTGSLIGPASPKYLEPIFAAKPLQLELLRENINNIIKGDVDRTPHAVRNYRALTALPRQSGGETNSYVADLSKKEIKKLQQQGYKIEYLD